MAVLFFNRHMQLLSQSMPGTFMCTGLVLLTLRASAGDVGMAVLFSNNYVQSLSQSMPGTFVWAAPEVLMAGVRPLP